MRIFPRFVRVKLGLGTKAVDVVVCGQDRLSRRAAVAQLTIGFMGGILCCCLSPVLSGIAMACDARCTRFSRAKDSRGNRQNAMEMCGKCRVFRATASQKGNYLFDPPSSVLILQSN